MKIALLGYGKMGKTIEKIALQRKHEIVLKQSSAPIDKKALQHADVAIDFSIPEAAFTNITTCAQLGIPVISGTTGWLAKYDEACQMVQKHEGKFIYASNFSLGVNLFFQLNASLAEMMANFTDYKVDLEEIHHTEKLDAPSGTAITLAEDIIQKNPNYVTWKYPSNQAMANQLPITAKRIEDVKGTHSIYYASKVDTIEIKHTAHTREGFAIGAVIAAEWLSNKTHPGTYSMKDVLHTFTA